MTSYTDDSLIIDELEILFDGDELIAEKNRGYIITVYFPNYKDLIGENFEESDYDKVKNSIDSEDNPFEKIEIKAMGSLGKSYYAPSYEVTTGFLRIELYSSCDGINKSPFFSSDVEGYDSECLFEKLPLTVSFSYEDGSEQAITIYLTNK